MNTLIGAIQLFTFFANVVLGIFVFAKNPRAKSNQAFGLFAAGTAGWILALYLAIFHFLPTLLAGRLTFFFASFMNAGLVWFTAEFPTRIKNYRIAHIAALLLGTGFAALSISPYMVLTAEIRENIYIYGTFNNGPYSAWSLFFLGSLFYALFLAWRGFRRSVGVTRRQYKSFAMGATIFMLAIIGTNLLIPSLLNDFRWNSIGPVFSIFLMTFVAQSMLYYRFLDVRWVLKWGIVFPILVSFVVAIITFTTLLFSSLLSKEYAYLISAIFLTIIFRPVYHWLDRLASHFARRGSYVFNEAVVEISHLVQNYLTLEDFQHAIVDLMQKFFRFIKIGVVTFVPGKVVILDTYLDGFPHTFAHVLHPLVQLTKDYGWDIVESQELKWRLQNQTDPTHTARDQQMYDEMAQLKIAAIVPFTIDGTLVGMMILGDKKSQEPLSVRDRKLLDIARSTMAPALANAARFLEMKKLYGRLLELDQAKGDFIRVVSHQFRTPLTAIRWNAELLLDEEKKMSVTTKEGVTNIQERTLFLTATLDRILDALALQSHSLKFDLQNICLSDALKDILPTYRRLAKQRGLQFEIEECRTQVMADQNRLVSIAQVLLDNAFQFTQSPGQVTLKCFIDAEKNMSGFSVTDTGVGISTTDISHIFEQFFRSKEAIHTVPDGAGVSLFVVKGFVAKMHGTVSVHSKPGEGSTFTILLPHGTNKPPKTKNRRPE